MKNINLFSKIALFLGVTAGFVACEPKEMDVPSVGTLPAVEQLHYTITQSDTSEFYFVLKNTSDVVGIPHWTIDGSKLSGQEVVVYFPLPATHTIQQTLLANGGSTTGDVSNFESTKTDYRFLNSPMNIMISGGASAVDGKTWVLDSTTVGHLAMGPNFSKPDDWWAAPALAKQGRDCYDDELNFKLVGLKATLVNHGRGYVGENGKTMAIFSNGVINVDTKEFTCDYTPPTDGSWKLSPDSMLTLDGSSPIWLGFWEDPVGKQYKVLKISENELTMACQQNGTANFWQFKLIVKGYVRPLVKFDAKFEATGNENEYVSSLANVVLPSGGVNVAKWEVDFGDGSPVVVSKNTNDSIKHVYLRAGKFPVSYKITQSNNTVLPASFSATIANDHSTYVPFDLKMFILYNDFSEVKVREFTTDGCTLLDTLNPQVINPNKSKYVGHYTKMNQTAGTVIMDLGAGYRFDFTTVTKFSMLVRGVKGQTIYFKLQNTDNADLSTKQAQIKYTFLADNTWELAEFDLTKVKVSGKFITDPTSTLSKGYYNTVRIVLMQGYATGSYSFYFDELRGPSVEGIKSLSIY